MRIFTRTLDEVTARLPEVVEAALALPARSFVLDGEAIALREDGRPHPFQVTGSRFASRSGHTVLLTPMFFDLLHLDGEDLLDRPASERAAALSALVPEPWRVPRGGPEMLEAALAQGHEGVVVKALDAPYEAGRRGAAWVKVKPVHTLDLVVLGVEWGSGRRRGKLSNLHLGARGADGGFVMLGKTFKGLTDAMLEWQTEKLLALEERRDGPRRVRAAGAGGRDRVRRRPDQPALPRRRRAALRARGPLPRGQARRGGRHARSGARAQRMISDDQHEEHDGHGDAATAAACVPTAVLRPAPPLDPAAASGATSIGRVARRRRVRTSVGGRELTFELHDLARALDRGRVMRGERRDLAAAQRRAPPPAAPARPAPRRAAARARARRSRPRPKRERGPERRARTRGGSAGAARRRRGGVGAARRRGGGAARRRRAAERGSAGAAAAAAAARSRRRHARRRFGRAARCGLARLDRRSAGFARRGAGGLRALAAGAGARVSEAPAASAPGDGRSRITSGATSRRAAVTPSCSPRQAKAAVQVPSPSAAHGLSSSSAIRRRRRSPSAQVQGRADEAVAADAEPAADDLEAVVASTRSARARTRGR